MFDSNGGWDFLLGKPLLWCFNAQQNFAEDTVTISEAGGENRKVLHNGGPKEAVKYYTKLIAPVQTVQARDKETIFTHETNPWKPECVVRIFQEVTIELDTTETQCKQVKETITEFADCFALSIKEVNAIPGAVHKLNIPDRMTFQTKIPPRSYNPDQKVFMEAKVMKMLEAGIVRRIHPCDVRFVAQTVFSTEST